MPAAAQAEGSCQHPDPDDPATACGASAAADQRCLAHLTPDARTEWLATLTPGSDINARGVTFTRDLLAELLNALRDPLNIPQIGPADFNRATFSEGAQFDGSTFVGDAGFEGATFVGDAAFEGATFVGDAQFERATFSGHAWFGGAEFSTVARFGGATFSQVATFGDATFSGATGFEGVTFTGHAWFSGATFSRLATFGGATFSGHARFEGATFSGVAWFGGATFSGYAGFDRTTFSGDAGISDASVIGTASFVKAVVRGQLRVEAAAKHVNMGGLRGEGRVSLRLRAAEVDLTDVVSAGPVSVHGLDHPIEGVDETRLRSGTAQVRPVRVMSLRGLDASSVTLTDVDLSRCRFAGLHRLDQIVLEGRCLFADGPGGRRRVLAEEYHWRAARTGGRWQRTGRWRRLPEPARRERVEVVGPARLEVLYRQLRKATEDAKNEPGAADFYYGEMEMRRAATTRRAERWLLGLYWAISGYGLRVRRALAWLALLTVLSVGGLTWFGFPQTAQDQKASGTVVTPAGRQPITLTIRQSDPVKPLTSRIEKATEVTVNAVIFRNPDADLTTAGRYLNIIIRVLGPILLGLSILAVRNQVKR